MWWLLIKAQTLENSVDCRVTLYSCLSVLYIVTQIAIWFFCETFILDTLEFMCQSLVPLKSVKLSQDKAINKTTKGVKKGLGPN